MGAYYVPNPIPNPGWAVGDRIKFARDRRLWDVRATTTNVIVLTRQADFKPKGVLFYTIVDVRAGVRGAVNTIGQGWGDGTFSDTECRALAEEIETGRHEISQRNWVSIEVES